MRIGEHFVDHHEHVDDDRQGVLATVDHRHVVSGVPGLRELREIVPVHIPVADRLIGCSAHHPDLMRAVDPHQPRRGNPPHGGGYEDEPEPCVRRAAQRARQCCTTSAQTSRLAARGSAIGADRFILHDEHHCVYTEKCVFMRSSDECMRERWIIRRCARWAGREWCAAPSAPRSRARTSITSRGIRPVVAHLPERDVPCAYACRFPRAACPRCTRLPPIGHDVPDGGPSVIAGPEICPAHGAAPAPRPRRCSPVPVCQPGLAPAQVPGGGTPRAAAGGRPHTRHAARDRILMAIPAGVAYRAPPCLPSPAPARDGAACVRVRSLACASIAINP